MSYYTKKKKLVEQTGFTWHFSFGFSFLKGKQGSVSKLGNNVADFQTKI